MLILSESGTALDQHCPVHGSCFCGRTHTEPVAGTLWCHMVTWASIVSTSLNDLLEHALQDLALRWFRAQGPERHAVRCSQCPATRQLIAPLLLPSPLLARCSRERLIALPCVSCPADAQLFVTAHIEAFGLAPVLDDADDRFFCSEHRPPRSATPPPLETGCVGARLS